MSLTDAKIRALRPKAKKYSMSDSGGLSLTVLPTGKKVWRISYRVDGKQKQDTLGEFPIISLDEAREALIQQKRKLAAGVVEQAKPLGHLAPAKDVDPEDLPASGDLGPLWPDVCSMWMTKRATEGLADKTKLKHKRFLERTYPSLGEKHPHHITGQEILAVCRAEEAQGKYENANRMKTTCSMVLRFALANGWCDRDVTADLRGALTASRDKHHAAITDPKAVGGLIRSINAYGGSFISKAALLLTAQTWLRSSELRLAEWSEIDWDEETWVIPAERMKMKKKHIVPLSKQSVEVLRMLNGLTARKGNLIFMSTHKQGRPISNMTMNNALQGMGYTTDMHVPHGFRTTASTNLNELGWNSDWIERQLAHVESNKVRGAYNAAKYLDDRRTMMQFYSDWLDERAAA